MFNADMILTRDAMLATYEKSVQTGFREVADALAVWAADPWRAHRPDAEVDAAT